MFFILEKFISPFSFRAEGETLDLPRREAFRFYLHVRRRFRQESLAADREIGRQAQDPPNRFPADESDPFVEDSEKDRFSLLPLRKRSIRDSL